MAIFLIFAGYFLRIIDYMKYYIGKFLIIKITAQYFTNTKAI